MVRGFVKLKKNQKIRVKLGNGWVGQAPTRILIFFGNFVYLVLFSCFQLFPKKIKKIDRLVGGWGLTNPRFSRILDSF